MFNSGLAITWGTTAAERARHYPCDDVVPAPATPLWRGVSVAAPPALVFRWLCQLRRAPYSYDWIDNGARRSPQELTPGLEQLAVGQRVMRIFDLVSFAPDQHLTIRVRQDGPLRLVGDGAMSYVVDRGPTGTTRLLGKLVVRYPTGPIGMVMRWGLPWGDLVMMRKQLLNLQRLAERDARRKQGPV